MATCCACGVWLADRKKDVRGNRAVASRLGALQGRRRRRRRKKRRKRRIWKIWKIWRRRTPTQT